MSSTRLAPRCLTRILPQSLLGRKLANSCRRCEFNIQRLPAELLAEIFTHCLPAEHERAEPKIFAAPLNVAGVCSYWRQLALSLPHLWSCFDVLQYFPFTDEFTELALTDAWLDRSQNAPLSFSFGVGVDKKKRDFERELFDVSFFFLCEQLLKHQCRWKRVSICYSDNMVTNFMGDFKLAMTEMTLLEDLHLHFPTDRVSPTVDLSHSPRLKSLCLSGKFSLSFGGVALENLKFIDLDINQFLPDGSLSLIDGLFVILQSAPRLEEFYATVPGDVASTDETVDIHLESLQVLGLSFFLADHTAVRSLLDRLTLPSLVEFNLAIELMHPIELHLPENVSFGIADFLGRSRAPLTHFALQAPAVRAGETLACLRLCPRLKSLALVDLFFSNFQMLDIITRLTLHCDDASESLFPELEILEFTARQLPNMYREFSSMLVSRWAVGIGARRYLREVRLREKDTWFVREGPAKRYIEKGLRVTSLNDLPGLKLIDRLLS
ncbi:hypothetical protein DFH11DRAFT_558425 [Phellopilus nigrolimitatus]|nr:hypothetical protein DFH11DRAFT_558425 [Phellopilus nigrolimitatus]